MDGAKKMEEEAKVHRIRITLTSRSIKDLEKVRSDSFFSLARALPGCPAQSSMRVRRALAGWAAVRSRSGWGQASERAAQFCSDEDLTSAPVCRSARTSSVAPRRSA